jgi:hypothetical protein
MGNLKGKMFFFELAVFIVNHCIIKIKHCNKIINSQHNYFIYNKVLLEESDKQENLEVPGAATASCLKRRL